MKRWVSLQVVKPYTFVGSLWQKKMKCKQIETITKMHSCAKISQLYNKSVHDHPCLRNKNSQNQVKSSSAPVRYCTKYVSRTHLRSQGSQMEDKIVSALVSGLQTSSYVRPRSTTEKRKRSVEPWHSVAPVQQLMELQDVMREKTSAHTDIGKHKKHWIFWP